MLRRLLLPGPSLVGQPARQLALLSLRLLVRPALLLGLGFPPPPGVAVWSVPQPDLATVDPHRLRGEPVEHPSVVRDHHSDPPEETQGLQEQVTGVPVEVIRRLVEEQDVGVGRQRGSHLPSLALPRRQRVPALEVPRIERQLRPQAAGVAVPGAGEIDRPVGDGVDGLLAQHDAAARRVDDDGAAVGLNTGDEGQQC